MMTIFDQQEKVAKDLKTRGFEVSYEVEGKSGTFYDMVAHRDDESMVFEFKPQSKLGLSSSSLSRIRQLAQQDGYKEFHLVVVPEEQATPIQISNLNQAILQWLQTHPDVKSNTLLGDVDVIFQRVEQVVVTSLQSQTGSSGTSITGVAILEFRVPALEDTVWDCPLRFAAYLGSTWQLESVQTLDLDLESIHEYLQDYLHDLVSEWPP